jgi:hypothetical protein
MGDPGWAGVNPNGRDSDKEDRNDPRRGGSTEDQNKLENALTMCLETTEATPTFTTCKAHFTLRAFLLLLLLLHLHLNVLMLMLHSILPVHFVPWETMCPSFTAAQKLSQARLEERGSLSMGSGGRWRCR